MVSLWRDFDYLDFLLHNLTTSVISHTPYPLLDVTFYHPSSFSLRPELVRPLQLFPRPGLEDDVFRYVREYKSLQPGESRERARRRTSRAKGAQRSASGGDRRTRAAKSEATAWYWRGFVQPMVVCSFRRSRGVACTGAKIVRIPVPPLPIPTRLIYAPRVTPRQAHPATQTTTPLTITATWAQAQLCNLPSQPPMPTGMSC